MFTSYPLCVLELIIWKETTYRDYTYDLTFPKENPEQLSHNHVFAMFISEAG